MSFRARIAVAGPALALAIGLTFAGAGLPPAADASAAAAAASARASFTEPPARRPPRASVTRRHSAAANKRGALPAARQLLARLRLPAGAQRVHGAHALSPPLQRPFQTPAVDNLLDMHRFWRVQGKPCKAMGWIERHQPAGSTRTSWAGPPGGPCQRIPPPQLPLPLREVAPPPPSVPAVWGAEFSFPAPRERFSLVALSVEVAAARGGGAGVRVDARVAWMIPR